MGSAAQQVIDQYFAAMRARDIEALLALFAEDAVMVLPDGRELAGARSIRGMYEYLLANNAPRPTPVAAILGTAGAATEIETQLEDGSSRKTANFFHLDAGLIQRLSVYQRG